MFGSTLHNPLFVIPGVYDLALFMAVLGLIAGAGLMRSGCTKYAAYAVCGAVCMSIVSIDLYHVIKTPPTLITLSGSAHVAFVWPHTSDLAIVLSVVALVTLWSLVRHFAKEKMLLSMSSSIVGFVATTVVALVTLTLRFDVQSRPRTALAPVVSSAWDILTLTLIGFMLTVLVVSVVRGVIYAWLRLKVRSFLRDFSLLDDEDLQPW